MKKNFLTLALETCRVWKARWIHWSIRKSCRLWGSWILGVIGPSNTTMIPSTLQTPPRLGCRRSPGRFYSDITVTWLLWCDLKKPVAARKTKNITELETIAYEEWDKIHYSSTKCKRCFSWWGWIILTLQKSLKVAFSVEFWEVTWNICCVELF